MRAPGGVGLPRRPQRRARGAGRGRTGRATAGDDHGDPMSVASRAVPEVALITYSTKPRGGVVHTLCLAEALRALGQPVHLFAMGDPTQGFYRPTEAPYTIIPAPAPADTLEERVW